MLKMIKDMKGMFRTREELGEHGWQFVERQGGATLLFKKEKRHIVWNSENNLIEDEFEYEII